MAETGPIVKASTIFSPLATNAPSGLLKYSLAIRLAVWNLFSPPILLVSIFKLTRSFSSSLDRDPSPPTSITFSILFFFIKSRVFLSKFSPPTKTIGRLFLILAPARATASTSFCPFTKNTEFDSFSSITLCPIFLEVSYLSLPLSLITSPVLSLSSLKTFSEIVFSPPITTTFSAPSLLSHLTHLLIAHPYLLVEADQLQIYLEEKIQEHRQKNLHQLSKQLFP